MDNFNCDFFVGINLTVFKVFLMRDYNLNKVKILATFELVGPSYIAILYTERTIVSGSVKQPAVVEFCAI